MARVNFQQCGYCEELYSEYSANGTCPGCDCDDSSAIMAIELGDYALQDGEVVEVAEVHNWGHLPTIVLDDGREYYIARDAEHAGEKAAQYWREMAENDVEEFICIVGEKTILAWALGRWAGPGSTQVRSIEEWFELVASVPEEEFAGYDHEEVEIGRYSEQLEEELGFVPTVAYRNN